MKKGLADIKEIHFSSKLRLKMGDNKGENLSVMLSYLPAQREPEKPSEHVQVNALPVFKH